MKKLSIFIVLILLFVVAVGTFIGRLGRSIPELGINGPRLESVVASDGNPLSVSELRGHYVLVNFWDSSNAMSRIAAGEYDRFFRTHARRGLDLLSVNTDNNRRLFNEIVRKDGLDSLTQCHIADVKARGITPDFHPEDGYSSYLLNPSGKIVAVNPTLATIDKILASGV